MKKLSGMLVAGGLLLGSAAFAQAKADAPAAEKTQCSCCKKMQGHDMASGAEQKR